VVYCRSGNRSAAAARILTDAGYTPVYDLGGIQDWVAEGLPIMN
jgi:rhodanese-related sulfurtransferase